MYLNDIKSLYTRWVQDTTPTPTKVPLRTVHVVHVPVHVSGEVGGQGVGDVQGRELAVDVVVVVESVFLPEK